MRHQGRTVEERLALLATRRHGVVRRAQLLRVGLTPGEIRHRLASGSLILEYPGVYRVGHRAPSVEATYMAAALACGEGAALSGLAAAYLHGLARGRPPKAEVISVRERRVEGVITARYRRLDPRNTTTWKGIPITTVPFTLTDLAGRLSRDALAWAFHQASIRHGTRPRQVEEVLARRPNVRGRRNLVWVLRGDVQVTASQLERKFLARLRRERLPLPKTNIRAGGRFVDCRWPDLRLTAELDSYRFHNSRYAWEQDHRRERQARARGDDFRRYTYTEVYEDPAAMMRELRTVLRNRPA